MEKNINLSAIDKRVIVEGWDNYKLLSEGDWVVMGCYPDEGCNNPTEEGRERAFSLLQGLYEMLEPFRESVVSTYKAKKNADNCFLLYDDEWIECANFIIREYEIQSRIKDMTNKGQKLHEGEGVPLMGGNASLKSEEFPYLPLEVDTERARNYFTKAIELGWITITPEGYKWHDIDGRNGHGEKGRLAYFLEKIYCPKMVETFPDEKLSSLFGKSRLGEMCRKVMNYKNGKPKRHQEIDRLFEDED